MNWDAIGAVGEIIGAIAVVATLGYLAIQIRQNTSTTRAATELEVTRQLSTWVGKARDDREFQRIWETVTTTHEALNSDDYRHYMWCIAELFHMGEGVLLQYQQGFLSSETWREWERLMGGFISIEPARDWWMKRKAPFSIEFYEYLDAVIRKGDVWEVVPVDHRNLALKEQQK